MRRREFLGAAVAVLPGLLAGCIVNPGGSPVTLAIEHARPGDGSFVSLLATLTLENRSSIPRWYVHHDPFRVPTPQHVELECIEESWERQISSGIFAGEAADGATVDVLGLRINSLRRILAVHLPPRTRVSIANYLLKAPRHFDQLEFVRTSSLRIGHRDLRYLLDSAHEAYGPTRTALELDIPIEFSVESRWNVPIAADKSVYDQSWPQFRRVL